MKNEFTFCEVCLKEVECVIKSNILMTCTIKNVTYEYLGKEAYCKECGNIVYNSYVMDYNLEALYDACRHTNNLISLSQIREIPEKYKIGKRPLSLLLGWGEHTFTRFFEGNLPTKQYSDVLTHICNNPEYYSTFLEKHKDRINIAAYNKSRIAVDKILGHKIDDKISTAARYLINKCGDITALTLQKALYYSQGLCASFYNSFIFEENCEAWIHGPVYRKIYDEYKEYEYRTIQPDKKRLDTSCLSSNEISILDCVSDYFCTFSGKVLEYFTHQEQPWIETRTGLKDTESSDRIISKKSIRKYFTNIKHKYDMNELCDVRLYTEDMFLSYLQYHK